MQQEATPVCAVAAWAAFQAPVEELEPLRQTTSVAGHPVPATFLRHADEQTVAGVAALNHAVAAAGLPDRGDYRRWGVLGCLQKPGRAVVAWNLERFQTEGAWGMSPHVIPHRCLHSLSGALSLALKAEGPNFGVGEPAAGPPLAAAWLAQGRVPGVWLVLTALEPEMPPDPDKSAAAPGSVARAVAVALVPDHPAASLRWRIRAGDRAGGPAWTVERIEAWLAGRVGGCWPLGGGLAVEPSGRWVGVPVSAPVGSLQEVRS